MMRNGQNKRMRGRNNNNNNRKSQNPLTRVYESNGPDVKIRGTANHVAEKYIQLARDAATSGDPVGAENYYQHAEHYFRLIAAAQEQFRQANPYYRPDNEARHDESYDDDDDNGSSMSNEPGYSPREPQQAQQQQQQHQPRHQNRDRQPYQRNNQYGRGPQPSQHTGANADEAASGNMAGTNSDGTLNGLPSFITGGQPQPSQPGNGQPTNGQTGHAAGNGAEGSEAQGDRYPMHRRRRRHRGPRPEGSNPPFATEDSQPSE